MNHHAFFAWIVKDRKWHSFFKKKFAGLLVNAN